MKELTWQHILKSQQQDFINRLELRSNLYNLLPRSYLEDFLNFNYIGVCNKFGVPKIPTLERIIKQLTSKLSPFSNNIQLQSA